MASGIRLPSLSTTPHWWMTSLSIGRQFAAIGRQFNTMRLSSSTNFLFGNSFSVFIVCNNFYRTGFVLRIHPHQTIALLTLRMLPAILYYRCCVLFGKVFGAFTLTLSIDEHLCRRIVGINKIGVTSSRPFQFQWGRIYNVSSLEFQMTAVQVVTVFWNTSKVYNTK